MPSNIIGDDKSKSLVGLARNSARNSSCMPAALFLSMFCEPLAHLVIGPIPFKRVRVQAIVLRPGDVQMLQKLLSAAPGITLQLAPADCPTQHFRWIQPR